MDVTPGGFSCAPPTVWWSCAGPRRAPRAVAYAGSEPPPPTLRPGLELNASDVSTGLPEAEGSQAASWYVTRPFASTHRFAACGMGGCGGEERYGAEDNGGRQGPTAPPRRFAGRPVGSVRVLHGQYAGGW